MSNVGPQAPAVAAAASTPQDIARFVVEAAVSAPHPSSERGSYALLTDGSTVQVRRARPEDADAVRAMHAAMSPDNMYLRFSA